MKAATFFDGATWREGVVAIDDKGGMSVRPVESPADLPRLDGVVVGGFTDHHVHLQLVEHERLVASRLGRVIDLGGNPEVVASYAEETHFVSLRSLSDRGESDRRDADPRESDRRDADRRDARAPRVEYAGAFLTPIGGYPSDRDWAPAGSVREIENSASAAAAAAAAVAEMADAGASVIKIASNSTAGPVFDDIVFRTIVDAASAHGLGVIAHAEGRGEAQRAARLGAAALAHAPFTERLDDDEIAEQAASVSWISTLAVHGGADLHVALDNVRRFHAAGGTLLYGTDMGNGPTPVDVSGPELAALRDAGLDAAALLRALAPVDPTLPSSPLFVLPAADADPLRARPLTADDLKV